MKNILKKLFDHLKSVYHFLLAFFGALVYRFPSRRIKVFGVTGTNGKTTTVDLACRIFKKAGYKVAAFSSIKFEIAGEERQNLYKMTMPGRAALQKLLREAVNKGCDVAIMEVTSEGIKQHRHRFIDFDAACFTNLTPEHIESHGGFENYKREKGKLFQATKSVHIINSDDENAGYFLKFPAERKIIFGIKDKEHLSKKEEEEHLVLNAEKVEASKNGINFKVEGKEFFLSLSGKFNIYNALAAIAFSKIERIDPGKARDALREAKVIPGRMEEVISSPFNVIIDYAVTPDTLEGVYTEMRESLSGGRLMAVLGSCGGGRDKWKRPVLGKIAAKYCDKIIITNEDPYNEDPKEILSMIKLGIMEAGFPEKDLYEIIDRRDAIGKALDLAEPGDGVIITGKGDEPWMCVSGGKKIPWNEREIIKEEYEKREIQENK